MLPTTYQQYIALSRYARFNEDHGRRETWPETVNRLLDFWEKRFPDAVKPIRSTLYDAITGCEVMPSMRSLMTAGPALERDLIAGYNCSFTPVRGSGEPIKVLNRTLRDAGFEDGITVHPRHPLVFDCIMYCLLCGTGVGFSVERQDVAELPKLRSPVSRKLYRPASFPGVPAAELSTFDAAFNTIQVADSKYGWASALRILIVELYNGNFDVAWNLSRVRPAGSPLKTFGGRSSGPAPLEELFVFTVALFRNATGERLTSIECHDLVCKIASVIVVGGVRRCLPSTAPVMTPVGMVPIKDIKPGDTVVTGGQHGRVVASEHTGTKRTIRIKHRFGELECTPEHRVAVFTSIMGWEFKPASALVPGDRLVWDTVGFDGSETCLPPLNEDLHFNAKDIHLPSLTEDVAWLIGLIHGDGYISEKGIEIAGNTQEMATLARAQRVFITDFGVQSVYGPDGRSGAGARLRVNSSALARWFATHIKQANTALQVPQFIANGQRGIRFAYLAGLFDADGRVNKKDGRIDQVTTIYESYARDTATMLAGLGIAAIVSSSSAERRRNRGENAKDFWTVRIVGTTNRKMYWAGCSPISMKLRGYSLAFKGSVDFSFPVRWTGTNNGYSPKGNISTNTMRYDLPLLPTRVIEIAEGREVETYDIEVEGLERFSTNGVVVHNSALISLSNLSDERMRRAKTGSWWELYGHRALANNSAVYTDKPDIGIFMDEWKSLYESKSGERGIFNREAAQAQAARIGRDPNHAFGSNPCCEIVLRPNELCNLSETVVRPDDTLEDLERKVELATILGTLQSTLTEFVYLPPEWQQNCEEERLLGVSLTGIMDHPVLSAADGATQVTAKQWLTHLREHARLVNAEWAGHLGINPSAARTCVKPSGTVSSLVDSASGIHPRYAQHYVRRVRSDVKDPLTQFMLDQGFQGEPDVTNAQNVVFSFPMKAPDHAVLRNDRTAIQQLEHWRLFKQHWCDHTASISVYVREHEWLEVGAWVYEHFDDITGVSFFPYSDHTYRQAPYEEITEEQYDALCRITPSTLDVERLAAFETSKTTTMHHELACAGGACEI